MVTFKNTAFVIAIERQVDSFEIFTPLSKVDLTNKREKRLSSFRPTFRAGRKRRKGKTRSLKLYTKGDPNIINSPGGTPWTKCIH